VQGQRAPTTSILPYSDTCRTATEWKKLAETTLAFVAARLRTKVDYRHLYCPTAQSGIGKPWLESGQNWFSYLPSRTK